MSGRRTEISQLLSALLEGETTAEALVTEQLDLLAREQPRLNAFIEVRAAAAIDEARASDRRRRAGDALGPLEGVPIALKDMFSTAGRRCTFGAPVDATRAAEPTATVAERLAASGAVNLGFLNMAPFALGATGHNPTYGDARNPWNTERITGGSSSGAGAATAAGIVAGAIGSDTGGSVRIPAACCGMVGLRPTSGRVSRYGAMPLAPSFDAIGPIAPSVDDVARLFAVICGPDADDPETAAPPPYLAPSRQGVSTGELVYPEAEIAAGADEDVRAAIARAVEVLTACGPAVVRAPLPDIAELHALADAVQASEAAAIHAARLASEPSAYAPHIRRRIEPGFGVSPSVYLEAVAHRRTRRERYLCDTLFGDRILVVPTLAHAAPSLATTDPETGDAIAELTRWTRWISYLDLPAISVPCGFDRDGMPIGLQLVAAPYAEARLLELAGAYERLTQWPNRPGSHP